MKDFTLPSLVSDRCSYLGFSVGIKNLSSIKFSLHQSRSSEKTRTGEFLSNNSNDFS